MNPISDSEDKPVRPVLRFFRRRLEEILGLLLFAAGIGLLAALAGWPPLAFMAKPVKTIWGLTGWGFCLAAISWGWVMFFHTAYIWRGWRKYAIIAASFAIAFFLAARFEGTGGLVGQSGFEGLERFFPQYAGLAQEFALFGLIGAIFVFVAGLPLSWRKMFSLRRREPEEEKTLSPLVKKLQEADRRSQAPNIFQKISARAQQTRLTDRLSSGIKSSSALYRRAGDQIARLFSYILFNLKSKLTRPQKKNLTLDNLDNLNNSEKPHLPRAPKARSMFAPKLPRKKKSPRKKSGKLPGLGLIEAPPSVRKTSARHSQAEELAAQLDVVLKDFHIKGEIRDISPGPVVTLFEFKPAPGIKSSRIIGLADDIARSMSALSARIAIIPGRNALGIEIPNQDREDVHFAHLAASQDYKNTRAHLPLILGTTIGGAPVIADLAAMPHLLVAGTTGSGKSMAINVMILSLLYRLRADQCRMIMIDPKMLELSVYQDIPHLLTPVVTDPKKAVAALKWIVQEMEARYQKMSEFNVRNIANYNQKISSADEHMPFIIVIIDEMADLMIVAGKEIEAAVQRLAQMARAAGIHLITATQRPSVDVITGTIKANFPTRISFQVTSRIDSRTILGEGGGEQLLGRGDMLFMMSGGKTQRVHGPFISDTHVERVAEFLRQNGPVPDYLEDITQTVPSDSEQSPLDSASGDDDLYAQAINIVAQNGRASTSFLQRKLQIGYNRAARLIERMEEEGIISAPNHAGKRQILHNFQDTLRSHG